MSITLEHAIVLAASAHAGQTDKAGAPYILHPLRVMGAQATHDARVVAIFHDVLEDCPGWNLDRLAAQGFTPAQVSALDALTKRSGESSDYMAFIRRVSANLLARSVKLADLRDNLDIGRLPRLSEADVSRINKYKAALAFLESS
jgi:(p)ppGpp synthase/HD superfamily hydrolase